MSKLEKRIFIGKHGAGKTKWLLDKMKYEDSLDHKLYYLGNKKDLEKLTNKLHSLGCYANIQLIDKDHIVNPSEESAIFTDELIHSLWYIWPMSVRTICECNCRWYITMAEEDCVNISTFEEIDASYNTNLDIE